MNDDIRDSLYFVLFSIGIVAVIFLAALFQRMFCDLLDDISNWFESKKRSKK